MTQPDELLRFWFGGEVDQGETARLQAGLWWGHAPETDRELAERFGASTAAAAAGELDGWAAGARGRLALILLLDQLPRAIHRRTPKAFATDARALVLATEAIVGGLDRALRPIERVFVALPLEHAEDLEVQEASVRYFLALEAEVPPPLRPVFGEFVDFAVRHREIIARFGRFPHRNEVLGRTSTPEELEFLAGPGSSF